MRPTLAPENASRPADAHHTRRRLVQNPDSAQFRLQAATQVVHQLTPEQRRYLKAEMAKPDSEKGILEAVPKVFHLKLEDKD